jgi:hypothetical protein
MVQKCKKCNVRHVILLICQTKRCILTSDFVLLHGSYSKIRKMWQNLTKSVKFTCIFSRVSCNFRTSSYDAKVTVTPTSLNTPMMSMTGANNDLKFRVFARKAFRKKKTYGSSGIFSIRIFFFISKTQKTQKTQKKSFYFSTEISRFQNFLSFCTTCFVGIPKLHVLNTKKTVLSTRLEFCNFESDRYLP